MATSEIEKLERRYAENPHGLTFAPLAEVHRKNGDVPRALELLTAGLELHPNYIPASIVLGRCHQDLGDLPAAEAAFAHVLRLDDENVIALKSLADINEHLERFAEAENWLRRLVSVDRSNDEARDQLRRLEAKEKEAEAARASAEPSGPVLEVIDLDTEPVTESADPITLSPETASEGAEPAAVSAELEPAPQELLPVDLAALELSHLPADVAAPEPAESPVTAAFPGEPVEPASVSEDGAVSPVAGLISAEFQPPLEAIGGLGVETSEEVVLEVSGNSEFRVPDASEDFRALADRLSAPPPPPEAATPPPAPQKIAQETPAPEPEPLRAEAPAKEAPAMKPPVTRRSYVAQETNGRSVASFFHALLAARPWAEPGSEGNSSQIDGNSSSHATQQSSSLGSLAGDDHSRVPPATPASEPKADGAVSFDDFFGSEPEGSPLRQRSDPGKDDLDQFQSWLQNLKR